MSLEGETGPAFQNCYARLLFVLSEHPHDIDYASLDYSDLESEDYTELLRIMAQYPDTAAASYRTMEPAGIVGYVFRLVDQLMLTLDDEQEQGDEGGSETLVQARMALFENARQVLENALGLLGVKPVSL
jgi:arginyl-tRNA synthetase